MPPTMEDEYTVILQDRHDNEASEDEGDESEDDSVVATENPPHVVSPAPKGANSPKKRPRSPEDDNPTIFVAEPPKKKVNRKYSIAHEFITNRNFYVIHIDVEHGGEGCGIVQLSAVIYDPAQWKSKKFDRESCPYFNEYIKPPDDAVWDPIACGVHGLGPTDKRIREADDLITVWHKFEQFVNEYTNNKKGILCAWNGKSCDVKWLWTVTEETHVEQCNMPKNIDYFLDPVKLIKHYKSCRLNQSKSKVNGYGLAEVWCFVTEKTKLEGAHNSLVDTFAQCEILHDDRLLPFLDKPAGIELMEDILEPKRKARQLLMDETKRDLPIGWVDRCDEYFTVNGQKRTSSEVQQIALNSSAGGGRRGPNMGMWNLLRQESLVDLFLNFFKKTFLQIIARETNRYGNEDWVKLTSTGGYFNFAQEGVVEDLGDEEEDTEPRSKPKRAFVPCNKDDPDRRKRHSGSKWKDVTPGLLLICFGSTLVKGATKIRKINLLWKKYLGMTSRKRYLHPECKKTRLGCPGCNRGNGQHVCKSCWKTYKHDDER